MILFWLRHTLFDSLQARLVGAPSAADQQPSLPNGPSIQRRRFSMPSWPRRPFVMTCQGNHPGNGSRYCEQSSLVHGGHKRHNVCFALRTHDAAQTGCPSTCSDVCCVLCITVAEKSSLHLPRFSFFSVCVSQVTAHQPEAVTNGHTSYLQVPGLGRHGERGWYIV